MLDNRIATVLRAVLKEEPIAAQSMFYFKPPGARGQGLHQDNMPLAVKPGTCIAAWFAIDDCDTANGTLNVVPGTGPFNLLCDAEREEAVDRFFDGNSLKLPEGVQAVPAIMKAGDMLLFNGQLIHGSEPNTTADRWRRSLIFHYVPDSCEEVAGFYHPLLGMDGQPVERRISPEGGPCGKFVEMAR